MKKFRLWFIFLQLPLDFLMVVAAFLVAYSLRLHNFLAPEFSYILPFPEYAKLILLLAVGWVVVFALTGMYASRNLDLSLWRIFAKVLVAISVSLALFIVALFVFKETFFSRLIVGYAWFLTVALVFIGRVILMLIRRLLVRSGILHERIVVIGDNAAAKQIGEFYDKKMAKVFSLHSDKIANGGLETEMKKLSADLVILTVDLPMNLNLDLINFCESHDIRFCYTPSLVGLYAVNSTIDPIANYPLIEIKPTPLDGWGRIAKRLFDFLLAAIGVVLLSPLLIMVAILVRLTSPGSALYIQKRPGQFGKSFNLYKFRSMYTHLSTGEEYGGKMATDLREELKTTRNEGAGLLFKVKDDPRVTYLGKFIRRTSIDELPQLFNVLNGEMSLVGPRPPLPDEVAKYNQGQLRRMLVKPGVTGMWQVSGRNETTFDEYMKLDMYYIEHWSLLLDVQIIFRTMGAVIKGRGAY